MTRESANDVVIDGLTEIVLQKGDEMYNEHDAMRWTMSMMWCDVQWAWCDEMYNEHDLMRWAWLDRMGMMWQDEHDVTRWAWCVEMSMIWQDEQITRCVEMNNKHNVTIYTMSTMRRDEYDWIWRDEIVRKRKCQANGHQWTHWNCTFGRWGPWVMRWAADHDIMCPKTEVTPFTESEW